MTARSLAGLLDYMEEMTEGEAVATEAVAAARSFYAADHPGQVPDYPWILCQGPWRAGGKAGGRAETEGM
jgi:hypothetical protein